MKPHGPKSVGKRAQRKTPNATQPKPPGGAASSGRLSTAKIVIAALAVASLFGGLGFAFQTFYGGWWGGSASHASPASFVGSETCAGCHRPEAELWRSSQHKLAMQHASDKTVLGDFNDASFDYYGVQSRFFRKDGKFLVETDGPDGTLGTYEIKYTFGVDPLQQYLIEFSDGRLQALSIAWDSRPKDQGGQRWFHLYPNEQIKHDDILHWTKLNQNWNFMCAECHSTGVQKNYDAKDDRFATTWAEISVGCETCHGQGSRHVAWAQRAQSWWPFGKDKSEDQNKGLLVHFDERHDIIWRPDARTGNAQRNYTPAILRKEVETCGLCHARRGQFSEDWIPGRWLSDTHVVASLARGLYYPDGQIRDEVYNYGSFKQSRMFAAGVTCSDCHEPHGAKLRAPGDGVCMQCHSPDKYATDSHHHHGSASTALSCASCHMPAGTYMIVDRRHDHGFRVPRPDLSVKLGTPNTCNACHADKAADWAAAAIESWHGPDRKGWQTYAGAFHAGWTEQIDAAALLALVAGGNAPRFARASALAELAPYVSPANINLARGALSDPDPMVRIGALDMLGNLPPAQIWQLVSPLLSDSSRGVRIRAVALLAAVPTAGQPPADRERFEHAATEFIAAQRRNADRPEARTTLGSFFARRGRSNDAEVEYKAALRLNPQFAAAAVNLADLYRQLGRDSEGESTLRGTIAASPQDAALHYALGLVLTRLKRTDEALDELRHAAELEPERARYAYVYAVALNSAGRGPQTVALLKEILVRHPNNRDTLSALISFTRDAGEIATALEYAEQLAKAFPGDPSVTALVEDLRRRFAK
jgi:predicted CXXCH cytochrome family protein